MSEKQTEYKTDARIVRVRKNANYFTASNIPFNDKRLSWEARGLMGYLLSKPDNWIVNMTNLENEGPAKDSKLRRMLSELRIYGYMTRTRVKNADGSFTWTTDIYEDPADNPNPSSSYRKSTSGTATSAKTADIVLTEIPSTESFDDEAQKKQNLAFVSKLYQSNIGAITPLMAEEFPEVADTFPREWIEKAFRIAVANNARRWVYVRSCLDNMQKHGVDWTPPKQGQRAPAQQKQTLTQAQQQLQQWVAAQGAD